MKPDRFHPHVSSQSSLHREAFGPILQQKSYSICHHAVLSSLLLGLLEYLCFPG